MFVGYVDTASALCEETRANMKRFEQAAAVEAFRAEHGFHPAQCVISRGVLRDPEPFIDKYVQRLDEAGFTIHIHAIGDRAVRVGVDALAQVIKPGSGNPLRHTMAHLQLVAPEDQKRIGEMGLYLAWTYAWALTDPAYDMTVMPFIGDVTGPGGIYDPDSYRMKNSYPVRSTMEFGAVPVAGSDAPVDDRSPRPFVNMAVGVTRKGLDGKFLNADASHRYSSDDRGLYHQWRPRAEPGKDHRLHRGGQESRPDRAGSQYRRTVRKRPGR